MKESYEINLLRKAAELTWAGIQHIKHCLRVGVTEEEIAFEFEMFVRSRGAKGLSFDPIIAFGDHSALPHHRASQKRLEANQIVLIDVGAVVDHYRGDATRVVFFGEPNEELQRMHKIVFEAYFAAKARVRIGQTVGSLDRVVRDFFAKEGVEDLFVHSLGHGIGLETHEPPLLRCDGADRDTLLQAGMVFTIEPGLYLPGFGGIRYENTGVLTENGFESFYSEI
jgi:Xaa-Pro aminopeptidase